MAWPPDLNDLKLDASIAVTRDDAQLDTVLDASIAFVERYHAARYFTTPAAPTLSTASAGGTVAAGTYTVSVAYLTTQGTNVSSATATVTTTGSASTITIASPVPAPKAYGWVAYVSQAGGGSTVYGQGHWLPVGCDLVLTAPPVITGYLPTAVPDDFTLGTIRLALRWHNRRKSPDGLMSMGEATAKIPSTDPDIARMLKLNYYARAVIA